ncbi:MAG TPA: hypothetical protein PLL10_00545 [Elusimicrobiales bacterium]|nr:hypothetical protein [Elusimicrobiales bacterium]
MELENERQGAQEKSLVAARIIWAGIAGGVVIMGLLGLAVLRGILPGIKLAVMPLPPQVLRLSIYALSAIILLSAEAVKRLVSRSASGERQLLQSMNISLVLSCAAAEAPALLGLLQLFVGGGGVDFYVLWAVSLAFLARNFPYREQWLSALRREKTPPAVG